MTRTLIPVRQAAVLVLLPSAALTASGQVHHELRSDNGVRELGYTLLNNEAMIGNYYNAPGGSELTITSVEVALGAGQAGRPFDLLVYADADSDGDPSNATLLSTTPGVIIGDPPSPQTLKLQTVAIDPVAVQGGFFVAVHLTDQPFTPPNYNGDWETAPSAYRLDYQSPANNWRITGFPNNGPMGGITPIDTNDLNNNFVTAVQLNWVIRVTGTTPAEPMLADMNADGMHDMWDIALFLDLFTNDGADFNADGVTNYFDMAAFLAAWSQPAG